MQGYVLKVRCVYMGCRSDRFYRHGMPNDLMQNFDPISIIVVIPILDRLVYPALRRLHIELKPIARITIGFVLAGLCLAYAAIVQHIIYSAGPCYGSPGACPAGLDGQSPLPNRVHIAVQTPAYVLIGVSEIFISGMSFRSDCMVIFELIRYSHWPRVCLHQSPTQHEVIRPVPLPFHFCARLRSQ